MGKGRRAPGRPVAHGQWHVARPGPFICVRTQKEMPPGFNLIIWPGGPRPDFALRGASDAPLKAPHFLLCAYRDHYSLCARLFFVCAHKNVSSGTLSMGMNSRTGGSDDDYDAQGQLVNAMF